MVSEHEMRDCWEKNVIVHRKKDGDFKGYCTYFYQSEGEDEEAMLEFDTEIIFHSDIESIEILD